MNGAARPLPDTDVDEGRLVADLTDFIALSSINPFGEPPRLGFREEEFANDYRQRLAGLGLETGITTVVPGRPNVWGRIRGRGVGPNVMLAGHMDTVGIDGYPDALSPRIENGRVYGRGACDMKAALAAFIEVARIIKLRSVELPGDLIIAALCDEENQMLGSRDFGVNGPKADFAIVGEPSSLDICPAHSGEVSFSIRVFGKAVHSSRPENGDNAIVRMAHVLAALESYPEDLARARQHPLCGYGRFSPGVIRGGTIPSSVPDFCELEVDRRTIPGETAEQVLAELEARLAPLKLADPAFRYEIVGPGLNVAALDTPVASPIVAALQAACKSVFGRDARIVAFPGGTDAPYLSCPAVICGPGDLAQAHTLNEFVEIKQIADSARVYLRAIEEIMGTTE